MNTPKELCLIVGYESFKGYRIFPDGKVESNKIKKYEKGTVGCKWINGDIWIPLKLTKNPKSGYRQIRISDGCKYKTILIHHLVMAAFGPPKPFEDAWRLHKDDNKDNNDISNLYWGTPQQNSLDITKNGNRKTLKGEDVINSKLTEEKVKYIINSDKFDVELSKEFNVCQQLISDIRAGKRWKHIEGERKKSSYNRKSPKGKSSANAKLSPEIVVDIYKRVWSGEKQDSLALEFNLKQQEISKIKLGIIYKCITKDLDI